MQTCLLLVLPALAHRPYFSEGHTTPESAFVADDPDISIVLYDPVTCEGPELWMRFDAEPGYTATNQLGVPEIERLEGYRPNLAAVFFNGRDLAEGAGLVEAWAEAGFTIGNHTWSHAGLQRTPVEEWLSSTAGRTTGRRAAGSPGWRGSIPTSSQSGTGSARRRSG